MREQTKQAVVDSFDDSLTIEKRFSVLQKVRDLLLEDISYMKMSLGELKETLKGVKDVRKLYEQNTIADLSKAKQRVDDKIQFLESLIINKESILNKL